MSQKPKFEKLWVGQHILKEQDEKCSLAIQAWIMKVTDPSQFLKDLYGVIKAIG